MSRNRVTTVAADTISETVERRIFIIRGHRVMLSNHLAQLYEVEPRSLVQAVKRNARRFPADFMFQLMPQEFTNLKSQIVISSWGGIRRALPYAFTEQGIAMLSSVLNSERAIQVNMAIMRAFVKLREIMATHKDLARRIAEMERKFAEHDSQFQIVFDAIRKLIESEAEPPLPPKPKIGFSVGSQ